MNDARELALENKIARLEMKLAEAESSREPAGYGAWVSVDDRLPEHGQRVLCCYKGVYNSRVVTFRIGGANNHFGSPNELDGMGSQPATHWMPLPDAP